MNYKTAVVGVVDHDGDILIGQKKNSGILANAWHIPGGKVNAGEDPLLAIAREIKEETNIDVIVDKQLAERIDDVHGYRVLWYLCHPTTHDLNAGGDLTSVCYVSKALVDQYCSPQAVKLWPQEFLDYLKM